MTIRFGTDGWRAVISENFTFHNLRLVSQAIADFVLAENADTTPSLVVGYDTRFLSDRYAAEVARVMAANGIPSWLARARCAHSRRQLRRARQRGHRRRHDHRQPQRAPLQWPQAESWLWRAAPAQSKAKGWNSCWKTTWPAPADPT